MHTVYNAGHSPCGYFGYYKFIVWVWTNSMDDGDNSVTSINYLMGLKGRIRCKMDLGYFSYGNELGCSFGSKKAHVYAFLSWLFLADSTKML